LQKNLLIRGNTFSTEGFPSVMVPVLSVIRTFTLFIFSSASAFYQNPDCAPFPTPTITDMGVANPSTGHASIPQWH
jgi:hypothetical protein